MKLSDFRKKSITRRVWSVVLTIVMVFNLMCGYVAVSESSVTDVKAATKTLAELKAENKASSATYRNVMYYGEWSVYAGQKNFYPSKIDGSLITHLNFAFMDVDEKGNLNVCDYWADFDNPNVGYSVGSESLYAGVLGAMLLLRQQYPNMKIGISVGGWTRSGAFPKLASTAETRKKFAQNIAKFVHYYGYDFVDIDWEYPTADRDPDPTGNGVTVDKGCKGSEADTKNFTLLMQELRNTLDEYSVKDGKYYELSCAMSASPAMMAKIEYDKVLQTVDFANMMTYDLNGAWNGYTAHQTALYTNDSYDHDKQKDAQFSVDTCVKYLEDTYGDKVDMSKVVIGVAPYTRGWAEVKNDGLDPDNPGLYATATPNSVKAADGTTSGTYAYGDIDTLISQYKLKEYYDEKAQAAYYYSAETGYFFTCDNERSVAAKGDYVKKKGLGGLISWMASLDSTNAVTKTMKDSLYGSASLPNQKIVIPQKDNISVDIATSGSAYTFTVKNNNTLTESSEATLPNPSGDKAVLPQAETFGESVAYPTFYFKTKSGEILTGDWQSGGTISSGNGYTIITPPAWSSKKFAPGDSLTFTLKTSGTAKASDISEIYMTSKALENGEEMGKTVLYSDGTPAQTETTKKDDTHVTTKEGEVVTSKDNVTTKEDSTTKAATGDYPVWSPDSVKYELGVLVQYEGKVYECTYGHTSNSGWSPILAGTLWKERTDLVAGNPETTKGSGEEQTTEDNYTVNGKLPQHMVTGYWHNFLNGSKALKISDVPTYYDMICVAFTGNTSTPGEVTFELDSDLCKELGGYTKAQFIQDIKDAKAKGQHVIISVGGAEGRIEINSEAAAQRFANGLINIITEYGFEGVDIDLEGSAVTGVDYIAEALRTVHDHFGDDFIITMAPETYYIQADRLSANDITTSYLRLALKIKDILTICYPQFYNTGGMNGYGGSIVNPGTADFLTSMSTLVIEAGLRADQVAFGVPSMAKAAGSGYVSNDTIKTALNSMVNGTSSGGFTPPRKYPTFRGVMTWSINWDATNNYAWAKAMDAAVDEMPTTEVPTKAPTVETTKAPTVETTAPGEVTAKPTEVIGLSLISQNGAEVAFAWGQTQDQIKSGQTYNVYIDGSFYQSYTAATQVAYTFTKNGSHTIKVTAALNGTETAGSILSIKVSGLSESDTTVAQTEKPTSVTPTTGLSSRLMIGYYHTWDNAGNPFIKLRDVDSNWDVINISFAEPVSAGSTDGKMRFNISGLSSSYTKEDFKQDIKTLQAKGKKIVLSIGGYEGYFSLDSQAAVNQFVSDIKGFVDEYGFDGIDIDLEQSSVQFAQGNDKDIRKINSPKLANMVSAIKTIVHSYGDDFILSWAPETFYMQMGYMYYAGINQYCDSRAGSYLPMINALREETSFVHVQLYNSIAITAPDGVSYNMGTKEGVVAMCNMLLDGFYVGAGAGVAKSEATYFAPLRPDQVVIGVPSSAGAAGSGQISNANLQAAFSEIDAAHPGLRGIMSWSINWDSSQNGNSFVRENQAFLSNLRGDEETTQKPTEKPTEAPTEAPTQAPTEEPTTADPKTITISDDVNIEGYQVSTTLGGSRVVGSVEPTIDGKNVTKWGFVYAVDTIDGNSLGVTDADMYVGSTNKYVVSLDSTPAGTSNTVLGNSTTATYFVRTTLFSTNTTREFTTEYKVRAYAVLSDGSYVYSKAHTYSVYKICDQLYQSKKMNSSAAHDYLYNNILKVVDPLYKEVDYNWSIIVVK